MARIIYKHEITFKPSEIILIRHCKITHVGMQGSRLFLWEEHHEEWTDKDLWNFTVWPTGLAIPNHVGDLIGTVLDGSFVWHVYGSGKNV